MTTNAIPHPPIVSRDQWLSERKELLAREKELTRQYDLSTPNGAGCQWSESKRTMFSTVPAASNA
jgi:predicted dithiol-disulfide oxidoreductase (DUF899 family)